MIVLTRAQAGHFRAVLRHSLSDQEPSREMPALLYRTGPENEQLQAQKGELAVQFHRQGNMSVAEMAFPSSALAEFEGKSNDPVTLEMLNPGLGKASWQESGVPRSIEFDLIDKDKLPAFPALPKKFVDVPIDFLSALNEASLTTVKDHDRYALARVQLKSDGRVIASDGRQLFIQRGFEFPWKEDLQIPRIGVFGRKNLLPEEQVEIGVTGKSDTHVFVRLGPWSWAFQIDQTGRYPDVDLVIPNYDKCASRLRIDDADAGFLQKALPKLPGKEDEFSPITLDLTDKVFVRAKAQSANEAAEIELVRSDRDGKKVSAVMNRHYLLRALKMGFREIAITGSEKPMLCQDEDRLYLWVPLSKAAAIDSDPYIPKASSAEIDSSDFVPKQRREKIMPNNLTTTNGPPRPGKNNGPPPGGLEELIAEAEELRSLIQEGGARLSHLVSALKQQRKQSRVFRDAVASIQVSVHTPTAIKQSVIVRGSWRLEDESGSSQLESPVRFGPVAGR